MNSLAVVVDSPGGPDALQLRSRPLPPSPAPGQIRIRQAAVGVNFIDVYQRSGLYPVPMPFVPGQEGAGTVLATGEGTAGVAAGDRVAYAGSPGAYADIRDIPADRIVALPASVPFDAAASLMLKGMTAHMLLHQVTVVKRGDTILVLAAAGGVGQLLTAWGAALGARVIAAVGSDEKAAVAKARGAESVIVYGREDLAGRARDLTGGRGVDVVYDSVGRTTLHASLDALRPRGLCVSFGQSSGTPAAVEVAQLMKKGCLYLTRPSLHVYTHERTALCATAEAMFGAVAAGILPVSVGGRYALREAATAHADLEGRRTTGALVLVP